MKALGREGPSVLDCSKAWVSVEEEMGTAWPGHESGRCGVVPGDQSQVSVSEVGAGIDARYLEPGFDSRGSRWCVLEQG